MTTCSCVGVYTKPEYSERAQNSHQFLERNMLLEKKDSLIAEARELIKIMTERALLHSFRASRLLLWSLN